MTLRKDERYLNQQGNLRYCAKHRHYYKVDDGCHFCARDLLSLARNSSTKPSPSSYTGRTKSAVLSTVRCLYCGEDSLLWDPRSCTYKCLNYSCRKVLAIGSTIKESEGEEVPVLKMSREMSWFEVTWLLLKMRINSLSKRRREGWRIFKNGLVIIAVLAATAILVASVCSLIAGAVPTSTGVIITLAGIGFLVWGLKSLSIYLSFAKMFLVVLFLGLFVFSSSIYLSVSSPTELKERVLSAVNVDNDTYRASIDAVIERATLQIKEASLQSGETPEPFLNTEVATL